MEAGSFMTLTMSFTCGHPIEYDIECHTDLEGLLGDLSIDRDRLAEGTHPCASCDAENGKVARVEVLLGRVVEQALSRPECYSHLRKRLQKAVFVELVQATYQQYDDELTAITNKYWITAFEIWAALSVESLTDDELKVLVQDVQECFGYGGIDGISPAYLVVSDKLLKAYLKAHGPSVVSWM
ncbi:Uu.00g062460.m01.CDS01 [Anthostomella pinea]|uniref:Uu.00g062460.m01.CDS01 n=1 Tax=Anthostomella pinea TaxID=933095 RepID=A0AAI8VT64_9PEZI|nr:Uu.00g062460.m01.CDS01 [Anthostomella pinea]